MIVAAVLACLGAVLFFGLGFFLSPQDTLTKSDVIVVISGGRTTNRAETGIKLYKDKLAPRLIFSGAALDDGPSNAATMRQQALAEGIPASAIQIDEDSHNTYQNATNSKLYVDDTHAKKIILVTSPYHQRRASMTFKKIFGTGYTILDHSALDDRWSKRQWYKTGFSFNISMSELRKILFIYITGNYQ